MEAAHLQVLPHLLRQLLGRGARCDLGSYLQEHLELPPRLLHTMVSLRRVRPHAQSSALNFLRWKMYRGRQQVVRRFAT